MKRIVLISVILAMVLCLFAGCKSANVQEDSALAGELIAGSSQENGGQTSEGPQKVENQQSGKNEQADNNQQNQEQSGEEQQNNDQQPENSQPNNDQQPDQNDPQSGDDQQTPDQPSQGEDEQPEDGEQNGEEDPYAAMKADQSGTKVKIMCQNLRCDATADKGTDNDARIRRFRFQALVEKYDPDIIASQECDATWIDFLQTDYGAKYGMFYKYREGGNNESCPVLWKLDKYEKLEDGYFWLSKTPNTPGPSYEEGQLPRIINWVKLKDKETGVKFYILSAHYGFYNEDSSIAGIRDQVLTFFRSIKSDEYAFCMGDYNFPYQDKQYYIYTDGINMIDLRPTAEEMAANGHATLGDIRNGAYNGFKNADGTVFGDFIMATPRKNMTIDTFGYLYEQLGNEKTETHAGFISDHFAVYTEVRLGTDISYQEYWGENAK